MKIGVLLCDEMHDKLKASFISYEEMFRASFSNLKESVELQFYHCHQGQLPLNEYECDAYITSGSKYSVYNDVDWIRKLEEFVKLLYKRKITLVGICFGHQLIAKALGGKVEKSKQGWGVGARSFEVTTELSWMKPYKSMPSMLFSHQDQVVELPSGAVTIATGSFCPHSMFIVGDHFLGIQGHPEFTPNYSLALMDMRKTIIPYNIVSLGRDSLLNPIDSKLILSWIYQFMAERQHQKAKSGV